MENKVRITMKHLKINHILPLVNRYEDDIPLKNKSKPMLIINMQFQRKIKWFYQVFETLCKIEFKISFFQKLKKCNQI